MVQPIMHDPVFLARGSTPATPEDLPVARDLRDTLAAHAEECVGMAANMIGVSKRIVAFDFEDSILVMLNPVVLKKTGAYTATEGCLSLPGQRTAKRYKSIRVEYRDESFRVRIRTFTGWPAQILQHELDHCDGILI